MTRLLLLISGLNVGGAETTLSRLLKTIDRKRFQCLVVSLIEPGPVAVEIQEMGIDVVSLHMRKSVPSVLALLKLFFIMRSFRPNVIQSWMYHADLLATIAKFIYRKTKVVWNVRCSNMDVSKYSLMTGLTIRACTLLSHMPDKIIVNSFSGLEYHAALGYKAENCIVIPNGFDVDSFRPDLSARQKIREKLSVRLQDRLVGFVARYDPMKGHDLFLQAVRGLVGEMPEVKFLLCGEGADVQNAELTECARSLNVLDRLILLGRRDDVADVMNALDILVLPSLYGEGLPNVVGEAMACGVPCVVSNVGDSARLVGGTGVVVPSGNWEALAEGMRALLSRSEEDLQGMGREARTRIERHYDLRGMCRQYEDLYEQLSRSSQ